MDLKALSLLVLERNRQRNSCATNTEKLRNFQLQKMPEKLRKVAPRLRDQKRQNLDPENVIEYSEERSAILEYDAGMPRQEAEREAVRRAVLKFRLIENQGGGTVIGAQGDTLEDLKNALVQKYGAKLE